MTVPEGQFDSELLSLPPSERARLATLLISSLDELDVPEEDEELEPAWAEEAERRYQETIQDRVEVIPASEAMATARAALKQ